MRIDPKIAALVNDRSLQPGFRQLMQDVREQWRDTEFVSEILDQLEAYGGGAEIKDCPSLLRLTQDQLVAGCWRKLPG